MRLQYNSFFFETLLSSIKKIFERKEQRADIFLLVPFNNKKTKSLFIFGSLALLYIGSTILETFFG